MQMIPVGIEQFSDVVLLPVSSLPGVILKIGSSYEAMQLMKYI